MSEGNGELPTGWEESSLGEMAEIIRGITFPSSQKRTEPEKGCVVCLRTSNVQENVEWDDVLYIPREYVKNDSRWLRHLDILISMANSYELVGKVALTRLDPKDVTFGGFISAIRAQGIDQKYLFYALREPETKEWIRRTASRTVNIANISMKGINPTKLRIAPFAEQRRIVAKIEGLQERSRKAREALAEVGPLLEQFRQTLLAAAFCGDLTADWRAENPDVEPASELLARIRTERRQKWEQAELAKYKAKGKQPPKNWQDKYQEPDPVDETELPELPEGWCWATVAEITENHDSIRVPLKVTDRNKRSGPYPYYGAFGIIDDVDDFLFNGDYLLLAEDGKNLLERRRPISLIASGQFWVNNHAHVLTTFASMTLSYLKHFFNSPMLDLNPFLTGIDQVKLTRGAMDRIPVPIAPLEEQEKIVQLCQVGIESVALQFDSCAQLLIDLDHLDQSILAKAFRGELVPQDPNDEPAAVLLERIRQQREATTQNGQPKRKIKRTSRNKKS